MRTMPLALLGLVTQTLPTGTAAQAPTATKVESQVVATGEPGMRFIVSPRGAHLAVITQKGSRHVVLVDGVPGPPFDEIVPLDGTASEVGFSPDGKRYAYAFRSGAEHVVIVDGKEQLRVPYANGPSARTFVGPVLVRAGQSVFSPDGKHVAYLLHSMGPGPNGARFEEAHVVYDGTVGPPSHGSPELVYSPDGSRHAYIFGARAHTALNPGFDDKELLVVDGKIAPYTAGALQFTADGSHLFSQRTQSVAGRNSVTELLVDGRPTMRVLGIQIHMAPVGNGFVGVVQQQQAPGGAISNFLVVGATRIAGSDCPGDYAERVVFSADGKHFAATCQNQSTSKYTVLVDGKKGLEYQAITDLTWAPDGSRVMYKAYQDKYFVVTGDTESDAYGSVDSLQFGGGGKRTGYLARKTNGGPFAVVIDGKPMPRSDNVGLSDFGFSPDGSRWAYHAGRGFGDERTLSIDGVDQLAYSVHPFGRSHGGAAYRFSPDSKHIVSAGMPKANPGEANAGLFIDGRYFRLGTPTTVGGTFVYNPTFTADGRHLVFLVEVGDGTQRQSLLVDGKAVAQMESNASLAVNPGAWDMGADGVLTFLAQDAGTIKRFRVTLGSDTSVETMLALTKKP
ncbi:MAG TPA: hypothetical protein VHE78_16980 [Gemmatimonadaceae bacterium]|nr:hypothetical protein [Gemmatimonadaceae bacterium]